MAPSGSGSTNNATGILQATSGGTLQISGGVFTNNGILREIGTGQLQLTNNVHVMGGTLAASGSQIHSVLLYSHQRNQQWWTYA